jgi:hypothetical protein
MLFRTRHCRSIPEQQPAPIPVLRYYDHTLNNEIVPQLCIAIRDMIQSFPQLPPSIGETVGVGINGIATFGNKSGNRLNVPW